MKKFFVSSVAVIISLVTIVTVVHGKAKEEKTDNIKKIGMLPVNGTNIDEGLLKAIGYFTIMELQRRSIDVVDIKGQCQARDAGCIKAVHNKEGVDNIVLFEIIGYGDEIRGEMNLFVLTEGDKPRKASLDFVKEEMEMAIPRLVTAVLEDTSIGATVTTETMTSEESKAERFFESHGYGRAAIGGGVGLPGVNSKQSLLAVEGGYGHRWRRIAVEADTGILFHPRGDYISYSLLDLMGKYHFMDKNISPFAGVMAGIHYENVKIDPSIRRSGRWGMAVGASGGVTFLRHLKMNIPFEVRYQHAFVSGKDSNSILFILGVNF